jgi:hypothetical protein
LTAATKSNFIVFDPQNGVRQFRQVAVLAAVAAAVVVAA